MNIPVVRNGVLGCVLGAATLAACRDLAGRSDVERTSPGALPAVADGPSLRFAAAGFIYGRVTTEDGVIRQGRLRWGGDQEALWSNFFNGAKSENAWAIHAPKQRSSIRAFGKEIFSWDRTADTGRPFMTRFGDIARIELRGRDIQVILKSGTVFHIARYGADDMNDGVRLWDDRGRVENISEWGIRTIEFLPTPALQIGAAPLYGTVRTRAGVFTGLIQWNRKACTDTDELIGTNSAGTQRLRFKNIRTITRRSPDSVLVTFLDDPTGMMLAGQHAVALAGIYIDDERYGRVLVSAGAFERVDFAPAPSAPAYHDFRPGRPLGGEVVMRSGRRLSGRLVFDLDESETTETLDAPSQGIDYMIPFGSIASIVPGDPARTPRAQLTLVSGEVVYLDHSGDLHRSNGGMLVFTRDRDRPEHVPWADVERIDFVRPQ